MHFIFGHDAEMAEWMSQKWKGRPFSESYLLYNMVVGIASGQQIVGGLMFTGHNGSDIEVHYVGPKSLTRRVVRLIFSLALHQFNVNRVTIRTRKEHMARGVRKLGAVYEGTVRRLYGPTDEDIHAGQQFAFFRETIIKLAGHKED